MGSLGFSSSASRLTLAVFAFALLGVGCSSAVGQSPEAAQNPGNEGRGSGERTTGPNNAITDVAGVEVGHATNESDATGVTAVVMEDGGITGVEVGGGAPGTYNTDMLDPSKGGINVRGVFLSGGSWFGLETGAGLGRYLQEERGAANPPVTGAILYDLNRGADAEERVQNTPDLDMGYEAGQNATGGEVPIGSVGAGTGALTAGGSTKGGIGTASVELENGITVGSIVAVNAIGSPYDESRDCELYALRLERDDEFGNTRTPPPGQCRGESASGELEDGETATTIGVVATNADLTPGQAEKLAQATGDGLARAVNPVGLMGDGDTGFGVSTGEGPVPDASRGEFRQILEAAADSYSRAIADGVLEAESLGLAPTYCEKFEGACGGRGPR